MTGEWKLWLAIGFGLGADFAVVACPPRVKVVGKLRRKTITAIKTFVEEELPDTPFAFKGHFRPGRLHKLTWAGSPPQCVQQRIRNVMVELLS